jgi:hypothetical protein
MNINKYSRKKVINLLRWEGSVVGAAALRARDTVCSLVDKHTFKRNDRMHGANLILMFLGVKLREGRVYLLPDLSEVSNARFFQRLLFFLMMCLLLDIPAVQNMFDDEEKRQIKLMAIFCAIYYGPYFLTTFVSASAPKNDLTLIASLRALREERPFQGIAQQVLVMMDRHTDYLSPQLVTLALCDLSLPAEERQDLATALFNNLKIWPVTFDMTDVERPGPAMASGNTFWTENITPALSSFVTPSSFLIFHVCDQTPKDLDWLSQPVSQWQSSNSYFDFQYFVTHKHVVNDAAERAIGLIKPLASKFRKEEHLQESLKTMEELRIQFPKGRQKK